MDTGSGMPRQDLAEDLEQKIAGGNDDQSVQQASVMFRRPDNPDGEVSTGGPREASEQVEIFFDLDTIEKMLAAKETSLSAHFAVDLVKLHRGMSSLPTGSDADEELVQQQLLELIVEVLGADRAVIVFQDAGETLRLGAIAPKEKEVSVNRVVLKAALRDRKAILCNDAMNDRRFTKTATVRKDHIGSLIAYPLLRGGEAIGLIYADVQDRSDAFRLDNLPLLRIASKLLLLSSGSISSTPSSSSSGRGRSGSAR